MITQVTSDNSADTMKIEEAVFEAYVKALEVTDAPFADLAEESNVDATNGGVSALGFKESTKATVSLTSPSSFGTGVASDNGIKKVTVDIEDSGGNLLVRLYAYDFNISRE